MAPATQILLSGCLTFGVPLAAAVYDLFATARRSSGPDWRPDPRDPQDPAPTGGGGPADRALPAKALPPKALPPKALPQCLLDAAQGKRVRELA